jgi:hypothetical protein
VADVPVSATCQLADHGWGTPVPDPLRVCGEPAIAVITFGCIHEHVESPAACAGCAAELQRAADILVCPACEDGPEPHECPVVIEIRWLCDAAATRRSEDD